jgi:hypothetical protein
LIGEWMKESLGPSPEEMAMPAIVPFMSIPRCADASGTLSPRSRSHPCMKAISSACDALIRPATATSSGRLVRSFTSSAICTA